MNQIVLLADIASTGFARVDPTPLLTHTFPLDRIAEAYELFGEQREGMLKVAIRPWGLS